jgi:predicted FMN-binding regulatory protein PaiB
MYIPSQFQGQEPEQALVFMQHYSFAPWFGQLMAKQTQPTCPFKLKKKAKNYF